MEMNDYINMYESEAERAAMQAEWFYFDCIDRMSDLIISYGRDRVMADVTEDVVKKLSEFKDIGELPDVNGI
jgi:hypothetical protein